MLFGSNSYAFQGGSKYPEHRASIASTLGGVRDLKTLCRSVLWDVYNMELNDLKDKNRIIVSAPFIQSLIPLLSGFKGSTTVQNIRSAIHRYILDDLRGG